MRQSLIESIGRELSLRLMGDAVLQAIEENDRSCVKQKQPKWLIEPRAQSRLATGLLRCAFHHQHLDHSANKSLLHDESGVGSAAYR